MLTLSAAAVSGACSEQEYEDLTKPEKVTGNTQYAPYTIDWTEAADSCSTAFIERFYCSENRNGYEGVFSYREYNATGSANSNNYWQQAHAMAAMVGVLQPYQGDRCRGESPYRGLFPEMVR